MKLKKIIMQGYKKYKYKISDVDRRIEFVLLFDYSNFAKIYSHLYIDIDIDIKFFMITKHIFSQKFQKSYYYFLLDPQFLILKRRPWMTFFKKRPWVTLIFIFSFFFFTINRKKIKTGFKVLPNKIIEINLPYQLGNLPYRFELYYNFFYLTVFLATYQAINFKTKSTTPT